jgi:hypothetical protein
MLQSLVFFGGVGVAVGLGATFFATRLLSAVLYGVNPQDPPTYAGRSPSAHDYRCNGCLLASGSASDPVRSSRNTAGGIGERLWLFLELTLQLLPADQVPHALSNRHA